MKKKLALMIYPNFSMQEISSICFLFRWHYDVETVVFASSIDVVNAEEGPLFKPHKTFDEFNVDDYDCLILSGCSDFGSALKDVRNKAFLMQFKDNKDFIIGAICAGPIFLSQAGLLNDKKFTNSLFNEANELFTFINNSNNMYQPVVVSDNIITAVGDAFNDFAIAVARKVGYECLDKILTGIDYSKAHNDDDYKHPFPSDYLQEFKDEFKDFIK